MLIRKHIEKLADSEKLLIISDYEKYEEDGFIGDEPIRLHAKAWMIEIGAPSEYVIMYMQQIAFECYRYFALKYIRFIRTMKNQ